MSILDEKMPGLDPLVWYKRGDRYVLRPEIAGAIRQQARKLLLGVKPRAAYLVGSITGLRYNPESDIDVSIVVDVDPETLLALVENATRLSGKLAPGTQHPINFFVLESADLDKYDAVYDLMRKKWLKTSPDIGVSLLDVYDQWKRDVRQIDADKAEAWRSLIDIERLADVLSVSNSAEVAAKLRRRIKDLDAAVQEMAAEMSDIHRDRLEAFKRELELARRGLKKYPSPNLLPENVRYKLFERYHYLDFLKKLAKLVEETGSIDTPGDVRRVAQIIGRRK